MLARRGLRGGGWGNAWPTEVAEGWLPGPTIIVGQRFGRSQLALRSTKGRADGSSPSTWSRSNWKMTSAATLSALASTADMVRTCWEVRVVPEAEMLTSFDDLISPKEERRRDRQTDRLGGLEVDDQLEFGRLLDRQITRRGTP
jgi:hypothetical protein